MLLPPFGMIMTKWLAVQAAAQNPILPVLIMLGSVFTVVYWAKWIGIMLTMSYKSKYTVEKLSNIVRFPITLLVFCLFIISISLAPLYNVVISPFTEAFNFPEKTIVSGNAAGIWLYNDRGILIGGYATTFIILIIGALLIAIPYYLRKVREENIKPPYLCGEHYNNDIRGVEFIGPGESVEKAIINSHEGFWFFSENRLDIWLNFTAAAFIFAMFGVIIR
jgi:ech hydrogenase subunit A